MGDETYESLTQKIWGFEQNIEAVDAELARLREERHRLESFKEEAMLQRRALRNYFVFDSHFGQLIRFVKFGPAALADCLDWIQQQYPKKIFGDVHWHSDWAGTVMANGVSGFYRLVWEEEVKGV